MSCDVCGLPDPHDGRGDGVGSCDCPRCGGCGVADGSSLCECDDAGGPACWALQPGGTARCGLDADHEGDHHFNIWEPLEDEPEPATVYLPGDQPS